MRISKVLKRNINARRKRTRRRRLTRHFLQRSADGELDVADLDRVARVRLELEEKTLLYHRSCFIPEFRRRGRGDCLHRPVKREARAQRPNIGKPGPAAFRK